MTRRRSLSHIERLAVVEERMETLTGEVSEINLKLDRLLQLGHERSGTVDSVKASVDRLQLGYGRLKEDTEVIRASMTFARVVRRIVIWGTPLVAIAVWIAERSDLIAKLFRRG